MTGLIGGKRVRKSSRRIEAFGTVDELNAAIGLARAVNAERSRPPVRHPVERHLSRVQNTLFDIGSVLALPPDSSVRGSLPVGPRDVRRLEEAMDRWQEVLSPLRSFVLPGGGLLTAMLHLARTVCRRAEREVFRLAESEPISETIIIYLNRLSDFLFVLSRWVAKTADEPELLWKLPGNKGRSPT